MKKLKFCSLFLTFLLILGLQTSPLHAQQATPEAEARNVEDVEHSDNSDMFAAFETPMPDIQYLSKEQVVEQMKFYEKRRPSDDPYSGFRIFIPKDWQAAPEDLIRNTIQDNRIFGEIAAFYSDPYDTAKSSVKVEAFELKHNISAKNWLVKHMLDYGYIVEGVKSEGWNRAEALGVIYEGEGIDSKDRIVAILNGKRVILLTYSVPYYLWEEEKSYQATVLKSFGLLKEDSMNDNEMLSFDMTGYAEFNYPSNFKVGVLNQNDFDRPRIKLINFEANKTEVTDPDGRSVMKQYSKGIINVQIVMYDNTGTSLAEEIEMQKKLAEKLNVKIKQKLNSSLEVIFPPGMQTTQFDVYSGASINENNPNYEFWIASMKNAEAYYIITMLTPTKDSRYFAWIENKSAFEGVVSSIEPISFYEE